MGNNNRGGQMTSPPLKGREKGRAKARASGQMTMPKARAREKVMPRAKEKVNQVGVTRLITILRLPLWSEEASPRASLIGTNGVITMTVTTVTATAKANLTAGVRIRAKVRARTRAREKAGSRRAGDG